jgi:hypothetical protein
VGYSKTLKGARELSLIGADALHFEGSHYRDDIALDAV